MLTQLVSAATSLRTSPPPAIAAALAAQSRDDLQRCGRVTSQLRKVVRQLDGCSQQLARLYESSFDADTASLAQLSVLQQATAGAAPRPLLRSPAAAGPARGYGGRRRVHTCRSSATPRTR